MDRLLALLDRNPEYGPFMLDGQTHIVESYLEVCPEREEEIKAHVRAGRLLMGPWHLMPELFMLSGECHIRNLTKGLRVAERFGGAMRHGYLCDSPGFISQLAQILKGFGIETTCGWRGIGGYADTDRTPFWLESPDGSKVLMLYMPGAYGTAMDLGLGVERGAEVLEAIEKAERPMSVTGDLLLMEGGDHREAAEGVVEVVKALNARRDDVHISHSTLERYAKEVLAKEPELKTHRGELRATESSYLFASGILATRMNIKQANFRCQEALERRAEPLCAVRWAMAAGYPAGLLERSWRFLLDNAFHDVIYGGHVDAVNEDALNRYKQSFEIADWLAREAMSSIAYSVQGVDEVPGLILFNPTGQDYAGVVSLDVYLEVEPEAAREKYYLTEHDQQERQRHRLLPVPRDFVLRDADGRETPCQVNGRETVLLNEDESGRGVHRTGRAVMEKVSLSVAVDRIPAVGYARWAVAPAEKTRETESDLVLASSGCECENAFLQVKVNADGTLDVLDKAADAWYRGLHVIEDSGDVGDHYFFHEPESNILVTSRGQAAAMSVVKRGPVEIEFKIERTIDLPVGASADQRRRVAETAPCDVTTFVSVRSRSRRIDFRTVVVNRCRDHRMRVLFPTGIPGDRCHADSIFDVVERDRVPACGADWQEKAEGYFPQSLFADVSDGRRGVAFFNKGLPQYQTLADGTYCLTLFRAVSHLAKYHLPEYTESGSMQADACFRTPSAQMPGEAAYGYAAYFHEGGWREGHVHVAARQFCYPPLPVQTFPDRGGAPSLPPAMSFVRIEPDACLLSAVKRSEDGKSLIVRFHNAAAEDVEASVTLWKKFSRAQTADLREAPEAELPIDGASVSLPVRAHEIVTLRLTP